MAQKPGSNARVKVVETVRHPAAPAKKYGNNKPQPLASAARAPVHKTALD